MYCGVCGAPIGQPVKGRRERLLFFATPFFLVLLCVALSYELGVADPVDSGLLYAGVAVFIFLGAAGLFGVLAWMFSMPILSESYWHAGFFAIGQVAASAMLLHHIELKLLGEVMRNIGPVGYVQARAEIFAVSCLPLVFVGLLAVSARARILRFPESVRSAPVGLLLKNLVILLPVLTLVLAGGIHFSMSDAARGLVRARILYDLDAVDLTIKTAETALQGHDNYAPLHFVQGVAIIEGQSANYEPAEGRVHLEKAVALESDVPLYLFRLSMAYDLERKGLEAISAAASAAALLPEDAYLWQNLGDLSLKYRDHEGAVKAFKNSLKYSAENPVVLNNLAYTLIETDQELPQALEMAKMSVEKMPGLVFNLDTLAWALYKNGHHSEALEIMNDVFQGRSEVTPEVDFHYAMILHAMGMLSQPLKTFDSLLARPEVAADHNLFGQIFAARSKVAEAPGNEDKPAEIPTPVNGESSNE